MNKVCLVGRLTKDPRITTPSENNTCARFHLAVDGITNAQGEKQVDFIPITAWGKLAETIGKYCAKGRQISIVGRLRTWRREVNGETRFEMEVVAEQMGLLSSPPAADQGTSMASPASPNTCARVSNDDSDEEDDELPF